MTINEFWTCMDKWRAASDNDTEAFYETAQAELASMDAAAVKEFRGILGGYMYHINECVWLDMACKVINGYVSDDTSLYFNLWVLSQGRSAALNALKDPDSLADLPVIPWGNAEFEMLMGLGFDEDDYGYGAEEADESDDDEDGEFPPDMEGFHTSPFVAEIAQEIVYKNGDKWGGFEDFDDAMDAIPEHCPRLIARAKAEGFDWENYI